MPSFCCHALYPFCIRFVLAFSVARAVLPIFSILVYSVSWSIQHLGLT